MKLPTPQCWYSILAQPPLLDLPDIKERKKGEKEEKSNNRIVWIWSWFQWMLILLKIFLKSQLGFTFVDPSAPVKLLWFHLLIIIWFLSHSLTWPVSHPLKVIMEGIDNQYGQSCTQTLDLSFCQDFIVLWLTVRTKSHGCVWWWWWGGREQFGKGMVESISKRRKEKVCILFSICISLLIHCDGLQTHLYLRSSPNLAFLVETIHCSPPTGHLFLILYHSGSNFAWWLSPLYR